MYSHRPKHGFTLVELLVVIAIIGVLIALLLPAVQAAREAARRVQCSNHLKQMAVAINNYESMHHSFPSGEINGTKSNPGYEATMYWGAVGNCNGENCDHCSPVGQVGIWMNLIFPQMELQADYDLLDFEARPQNASAGNREVLKKKYPFLLCPSDSWTGTATFGKNSGEYRVAHYFANGGDVRNPTLPHFDGTYCDDANCMGCNMANGVFFNDSMTKAEDIVDGFSHTALLCETWGRAHEDPEAVSGGLDWVRGMGLHAYVYFDYPPNTKFNNIRSPWAANSFHADGVNIALVDGSVHFVSDLVSLHIFQALATIEGGEIFNLEKMK